ncbi:cytochrome P450 [Comamonas serinivorans]|uniref:Cytochrome P450 n=1 Tax=Comamonas serinivorans TaxID=1082851 RepID=A0A1Y0EID1_9BURK|nr:cytochrome P450 [Comamonas serinivorans]ARU03354.1 cytochrome P450 [Comamonas serinivorans]
MTTAVATPDVDLPAHIASFLVDAQGYADVERLHDTYTWMRAHNPLGRVTHPDYAPFWAVTKHADVTAISRNNTLFSNGASSVICRPQAFIDHLIAKNGIPHSVKALVHVDGEEHKALRGLTQSWFMPNSILKLNERISALARQNVDALARHNGQTVDFVTDLALHYPLHVIMDILGVPPEDEPRMLALTQEFFGNQDPDLKRGLDSGGSDNGLGLGQNMLAVVADFRAYFDRLTDERRRNPRNDVASLLASGTINGEPLGDLQRLGYYIIIATAGHDTTSSSASCAMWALAQHPELLPRLQADPALIPQFIDEAIRIATPVRHFMRTAMADTDIRGRTIRQGDWLMLCYGSANRDEEVFEQPFAFNIDRKPNRHLAFGFGAHVCLGQHLAKLELRLLFEALIPRLQRVEQVGEMRMMSSLFVGGPKTLPLRCVVQ